MAVIAASMVYQVRLYSLHLARSQLAINDLHYLCTGVAGTGADEVDFANAVGTFFGPLLKPMLTDAAKYYGCSVIRIVPGPSGLPINSTTAAGIGTAGAQALPLQTCGLLQKRTALGGKKGRGRIYVPFPDINYNTAAGIPSAAYAVLMVNLAAQVIATIVAATGGNTSTMVPGVYNRPSGVFTKITAATSPAKWATQRRRGDFGRVNAAPF